MKVTFPIYRTIETKKDPFLSVIVSHSETTRDRIPDRDDVVVDERADDSD